MLRPNDVENVNGMQRTMPDSTDSVISAAKRLQHDLRELNKNPITNIDARPIGDDLFRWTFTMFAPDGYWAGIPFHGHMKFTDTYPADPPKVILKTKLDHPNVFGDWICLDMIKVGNRAEHRPSKVHHAWWTWWIHALLSASVG